MNTLALSIMERTRELGLLPAIDMRRGQLAQMIAAEWVIIAVVGAGVGAVLGVVLGPGLGHAQPSEAISSLGGLRRPV